jgi:aspartyl-tRNA(Asn)/glutamyl-tRNA(Gln) amidotransferase subunit C
LGTKNNIDINGLAKLSQIKLSEPESSQARERIDGLLKLMESMKFLDLSDVEPMVAIPKAI